MTLYTLIKNLVEISGWNVSYLLGIKYIISGCRFLINEGSYMWVFTILEMGFTLERNASF